MDLQTLNSSDWSQAFAMMTTADGRRRLLDLADQCNWEDQTFDSWSIHALNAMLEGSDTPRWHEAMNGPDAEGFWKAIEGV